jgi:hypothetical protein
MGDETITTEDFFNSWKPPEKQKPTTLTEHEKANQPDIPDLYIHGFARNYYFDKTIDPIIAINYPNLLAAKKTNKSWYCGVDSNQLIWCTLELPSAEKTGLIVMHYNQLHEVFQLRLPTETLKQLLIERFLRIVASFLAAEHKLIAIQKLSAINLEANLEASLVEILTTLIFPNGETPALTRISDFASFAHTSLTPTSQWQPKEFTTLAFDLEPYITNPIANIDKLTDEEIFQIIKSRLETVLSTEGPDRDYLERKATHTGFRAEFIDTRDIAGGVGTPHFWSDLLGQRRPAGSIAKLARIFSKGRFAPSEGGDEISLWRVKTDEGDIGKLYAMEGNHRVAVMTALGISKFPAEIRDVIL